MKLIAPFLLLLMSFSISAQTDDWCPCMDPPKYFNNSYLDSILIVDDQLPYPLTSTEEAHPVLVTDHYFEEQESTIVPVELFVDKPINISPSDIEKTPSEIEKKVNLSPRDLIEKTSKEKRVEGKHKRKKWNGKIKRRKRARKYKGKCPSFQPVP